MQEPKEGTTRWRVVRYLEDRPEDSLNGIVQNVEGSAAAIRHAVEALLKSGHLKERVDYSAKGQVYTRRISLDRERVAG